MATNSLQLDFGLTFPAFTSDFSSYSAPVRCILGLVPQIGKFEGLNYPEGTVLWGNCQGASGELQVERSPEERQECIWQFFFPDPTLWWDKRQGNRAPQNFQVPLCYPRKPACVDMQQAASNDGMKTPPDVESASIQGGSGMHQGTLESGMCRTLCENGRVSDAVDALSLLVQQGCHIDNNLFYIILKRCIVHNDLVVGRRIHALTIKSGYEGDAFLATHLISLYGSNGRLEDAMEVFTRVCMPTVYNWTSIILALATHGEAARAIRLYRQMLESTTIKPDNRMYVAVLKACAAAGDLVAGKEVHGRILAISGKPNVFVLAGLVNMYAKCGSLGDARRVFDSLPERNVVTWTALIAGYTQQGMGQEALTLYSRMQQEGLTPPNSVTYVCLLQACASVGVGALDLGKQVHALIEENGVQKDLVLGGSLVNMYAKCGSLGDAHKVFNSLPERNVVTCNALLAGYAQQEMGQEALSLYSWLQLEDSIAADSVTYASLLQACASVGVGALDMGKKLHAQIVQQGLPEDMVLGGSLVNMYAKCGSLGEARRVLDRLPERDVVTWNALLSGYAQQGMGQEALNLYRQMQQEGLAPPNSVTYVCLLQACAFLAALHLGKELHAHIEERGLQADVAVGAGLVNMYAKCGSILDSQQVFDSLPQRSIEAWNALISGYARRGDFEVVSDLVPRMRLEGIQPDGITFLCLLTVCSHVGQVDKGRKYFEAMKADFGISPSIEHHTCMVDLLGRAGHLDEALRIAKTMPFLPDIRVWNTLLGACRKWKDVEIGWQAF